MQMRRVGIVGWRGMVGSVLMQRMREERDFDHVEPVFSHDVAERHLRRGYPVDRTGLTSPHQSSV